MTATVQEVLDGVASRLATIGFKQTKSYPPQEISPPAVHVVATSGEVETMDAGVTVLTFDIFLFTGAQIDRAGYQAAMRHVDATGDLSVMAAINDANSNETGFAGISGVSAACMAWRFLDQDDVDGFDAYGVVFSGLALITKEP